MNTLNALKKKTTAKSTNPFLHGSGGPKAAKQIKKANSQNAARVTPRSNTNKKVSAPKKSSGGATGAGGKFYKNGYVDSKGNRVVNGRWVAPSKAKAKSSGGSSSSSKKTGGAWSRDGKRFYKNGYVDSKGNKVVNGKWVAPSSGGSKKSSSGSSVKSSAPKTVAKTKTATVAKAKPKVSLLASDYQDQIYRNQLAELDGADAAYREDTEAKTKRLERDYDANRANVGLNKTNSLQNSAEDYASRGMMRSGAYQNNLAETTKLFDDQTARMASNFSDDNQEYARAKSDFLRGSNTQRQDAKRQLADRIAIENAKRTANSTS